MVCPRRNLLLPWHVIIDAILTVGHTPYCWISEPPLSFIFDVDCVASNEFVATGAHLLSNLKCDIMRYVSDGEKTHTPGLDVSFALNLVAKDDSPPPTQKNHRLRIITLAKAH